jgi:hypothetical protein
MDLGHMPMPKVDKYDQVIAELAAEHRRASEVWRKFQELAAENGWTDVPAERTVKRRVAEFHGLPDAQRQLNRLFRWPTSMHDGVVPWEAAEAALDLLRLRNELSVSRPVNREVLWFWRLTLARPDMNEEDRAHLATSLAKDDFAEVLTGRQFNEPYDENLEWYLAYAPWRSAEATERYARASKRKRNPVPVPRRGEGSLLPIRKGEQAELSYPFEQWAAGAERAVKDTTEGGNCG